LGVIYGGIGISKLQVLIKEIQFFFQQQFFIFGHQNPGSAIRKMLDPDPH
jgi:hypothetical protein